LPFWLHAIPANVRCSPIPHLPALSLDALLFYHVERLAQSFPRWFFSRQVGVGGGDTYPTPSATSTTTTTTQYGSPSRAFLVRTESLLD
jgi:hypothetical protein